MFIALIVLVLVLQARLPAQSKAADANPGLQGSGQSQGSSGQPSGNNAGAPGEQVSTATSGATSLMGAKMFGPGWIGATPSYFIPSFQWTTFASSNGGYGSDNQKPLYQGSAVGNLTLQRVSRNSQFNLSYAGGAEFYNQNVNNTTTNPTNSRESTFHQLSVGESVNGRRWSLYISDNASYLPESPGGFTGFGGLQSFNAGLGGSVFSSASNLNPLLEPDQSILTFARRVSNTSIGEFQYLVSPRTSVNVTGAYGILDFIDSGFNDENYIYLLAGLTHALGRRDYVGVTYQESMTHFNPAGQDLPQHGILLSSGPINPAGQDLRQHGVLLSYGHRFLGKLSFEVSGGPSLNQFTNPAGVSSSKIQFANLPEGSASEISWDILGALQYRWGQTDFNTYFGRSTTGGSGVLLGAETNHVEAQIGRTLFRTTRLELNVGYSQNQSLWYATTEADQAESKGWNGGINLSRELGRHLSLFIEYNVQRQVGNSNLCVANRCGVTFTQQTGGIGLNWHTRPMRLQ